MISSRAGLIVPAFRFCGMIVPFNADIISIRDVAVPYPDASGEKIGRDAAWCSGATLWVTLCALTPATTQARSASEGCAYYCGSSPAWAIVSRLGVEVVKCAPLEAAPSGDMMKGLNRLMTRSTVNLRSPRARSCLTPESEPPRNESRRPRARGRTGRRTRRSRPRRRASAPLSSALPRRSSRRPPRQGPATS